MIFKPPMALQVAGTDATIAIQLEIEGDPTGCATCNPSMPRPAATMEQQLRNASAALARANARLGTHAVIGTVMVDQEGWGTTGPEGVTRNNDEVYNTTAKVCLALLTGGQSFRRSNQAKPFFTGSTY
jgi:hypothetical protein